MNNRLQVSVYVLAFSVSLYILAVDWRVLYEDLSCCSVNPVTYKLNEIVKF